MKPSLPQIQRYMRHLADELVMAGFRGKAKRLRRWATQISRVKPLKVARTKHPMPTPAQVVAVRKFVTANPDITYREVANSFKVGNDGRVSEIMRGKRGRQVYDKRGVWIVR